MSFTSVNDLVRYLKQRFTPGKTFTYYCAQLNDLRMKQGETVGDFRDRLNILLMGAENALKEDKGATYDAVMMVPMKGAAVDIFIRGLPGNISAAVDASQPVDLDAALREAVRIEARIRSRILPDSRQSSYLSRYGENEELSANVRKPNYNEGQPRYSGYQQYPASAGHSSQQFPSIDNGPVFVGYMEQREVEPPQIYYEDALEYPEPEVMMSESPFVGYLAPSQPEGYGGRGYNQTPFSQGRGGYQSANRGFPPRRGVPNLYQGCRGGPNSYQGGRGGTPYPYQGGGNRPGNTPNPKLYDPNGPPTFLPQPPYPVPSSNQAAYTAATLPLAVPLNSKGARPEAKEARTHQMLTSGSSNSAPPSQETPMRNRVYLTQIPRHAGLRPVGLLEATTGERMTRQ